MTKDEKESAVQVASNSIFSLANVHCGRIVINNNSKAKVYIGSTVDGFEIVVEDNNATE